MMNSRAVRRFLPYLRPVRMQFGAGLVASVLGASMQWLAPWPLKLVFDSVMAQRPLPAVLAFLPASPHTRLNILALAMLATALFLGLFSYAAARFIAQAGQRVVFEIRRDFFRHLEAQSLGFHQRRSTGDLLSRLGGDTQALQSVMVDALPSLISNSLTLVGMVAIMLFMDWRFTLVALSLWPALYFTVRYFLRQIKVEQRHARRWEGEANTIAEETLTSLTVVQAFGREQHEADRFAHVTGQGLQANQRAATLQAAFTPIATALMTSATVLVVWLGVRAVLSGSLTPGDLIVFTAYLRGMYSPVRQLAKLANVVGRGQAAGERILEILDTREEIPERLDARVPTRVRGSVDLDAVSFAYPDGSDVLSNVTLHIPAGARVALVGATGSGKSTLLRFIPRFFDPTLGTVRLDGVDVREFTVAGLRRQMALVPQEPYVFRGTVWENIAYGGDEVSRDEAIAAARAVGVDSVLAGLSNGYDTLIAERGTTLSGGQRQCVALARAMARDPRVLLLDEPTTGLDSAVEAIVLTALARLARHRTTVVVSHDLAAVRDVDFVAVLEGGNVVQFGTPHDVLRSYTLAGASWPARAHADPIDGKAETAAPAMTEDQGLPPGELAHVPAFATSLAGAPAGITRPAAAVLVEALASAPPERSRRARRRRVVAGALGLVAMLALGAVYLTGSPGRWPGSLVLGASTPPVPPPSAAFASTHQGSGTVFLPVAQPAVAVRVGVDAGVVGKWFWCIESSFGIPLADHYCATAASFERATNEFVAQTVLRVDPAWPHDASYFIQMYCESACVWHVEGAPPPLTVAHVQDVTQGALHSSVRASTAPGDPITGSLPSHAFTP